MQTKLTEEEKKEIAEYVVDHLLTKIYREAGRSILKAAFWVLGLGILALYVYFGKIPILK